MISVKCTACGAGYRASDGMAGKNVKCKHCATVFSISRGTSHAASESQRSPAARKAPGIESAGSEHVRSLRKLSLRIMEDLGLNVGYDHYSSDTAFPHEQLAAQRRG